MPHSPHCRVRLLYLSTCSAASYLSSICSRAKRPSTSSRRRASRSAAAAHVEAAGMTTRLSRGRSAAPQPYRSHANAGCTEEGRACAAGRRLTHLPRPRDTSLRADPRPERAAGGRAARGRSRKGAAVTWPLRKPDRRAQVCGTARRASDARAQRMQPHCPAPRARAESGPRWGGAQGRPRPPASITAPGRGGRAGGPARPAAHLMEPRPRPHLRTDRARRRPAEGLHERAAH